MENPAQMPEQISSLEEHFNKQTAVISKEPSKIHLARVLLKLLPVAFKFRRDRRKWVKQEGKNIDEKKYRKHAEKALKTFIELGPSYIKLGQWLSTRADILPQPYLDVLAKLQDEVPPAPFSEVKSMIESELGDDIQHVFDEFNTSALSGASLGQVYLARYKGKDVIVKISRPNIEQIIEKDIFFLKKILPIATRFIDPNIRFSAEGMLSQFIETIHEEMDYRIEADNLITIKNNLKNDRMIIIPNVIQERTSKHVLTLDYIPGIKITDIEKLEAMGIDREKLVIRVHHVFFKMLLRHNIFHADPHPGNISVAPDTGAIILYDFGMVGRIDNETRIKLIRLYLGLVEKDAVRTVNALMDLKTLEPTVNRYVVEKALEMSIQSMHGKQVDRMEVNALMELANKTMTRFPFRLPKNLALYMRMTSILEGIYHHHKVKFHFVKVLANILEQEQLIKEAYKEEIKESIKRFTKNIEASIHVAPLLKSYLESQQQHYYNNPQRNNNNVLAGSIFASALFLGSVMMLPHNPNLSYGGFIVSAITLVTITTLWKKIRF
jgi:predicted unusual protein kinase regulating ubiquinone biosynthesis (AarF/ABC1/UbiB family)